MSSDSMQDRWSTWLLRTRFANDPERRKAFEEHLFPVRDHVLANARLSEGELLLDVGAGDGLIAFGALPFIGDTGKVVFTDVSQDLLDHARELAEQMGVLDRVEFRRLAADDLTGIADASVDIVTTRSVLIYVNGKGAAFREFYRVLRPGGRISIFEPINRFGSPWPAGTFLGIDVGPIEPIAAKVRTVYEQLQPRESDPMLDFDERDLVRHAELGGFHEIHLEYSATIQPRRPMRWEHLFLSSGNPNILTLQDAVSQVLTPAEAEAFVAYLRPRVEAGDGQSREAVAYLWAQK